MYCSNTVDIYVNRPHVPLRNISTLNAEVLFTTQWRDVIDPAVVFLRQYYDTRGLGLIPLLLCPAPHSSN